MERLGIVFHWKERALSCVRGDPPAPGSPSPIQLELASGQSLTVDELLVAAGRASNTGNLNLPAAGVKTGDRGLILVDSEFRTNVAHIFAAGDVIGFPALASTSMDQARRAVRSAFGLSNDAARSELMPHGIWTIPEIGMVGETEQSLQQKGIEYIVGHASYADNARGRIIGDTRGFLKLIFRRSDLEMVGAHVIGELATDVVHIGMMAMLARARADLFDELCFNLPTLGALYRFAAFDALRTAGLEAQVSQVEEVF
jgi:NAD(P) transhydrogenase